MATLKQIRRRIRSVKSTQQITRAMEMVAAAKLKRATDRALASRPYAQKAAEVLKSLAGATSDLSHPLFEERPVQKKLLVVLASDKGLCGSYNMTVFRRMENEHPRGSREGLLLYPVGKRSDAYFGKRPWTIHASMPELGDQTDPQKAKRLATELVQLYIDKKVDRISLVFTRYVSVISRRVVEEQLLPIVPETGGAHGQESKSENYIFEPSPEAIFESLLPRYVENRILQAMSESIASEHAARMVSMGAASKNAKEVIERLTLEGNKLRQAAITREISEIVGGVEALK
ncbi:MAG: ATP synthase F1 subunit gamma [Candidatus Eisenbacteria bacterium]